MNKLEKLQRIRKEIEELEDLKKQLILAAGYSSVDTYYEDLEKRNNKKKILINTTNIDKAA